jgi:hypothetical protein
MDSLGEDLVLLSVRPDKGTIMTGERIGFGLMGSELVRLAATGRIDIQNGRILVLSPVPTGDPELDAALASLHRSRRPARPTQWVGRPRKGILQAYLARLVAAGALRPERRFLTTRHFVADHARVTSARAHLDAIALSAGMVDTAQAAFGGLAPALALDRALYRGRAARPVHKRLAEMAKGQWTAAAVNQAAADAARRAMRATDAASRAATDAATQAATHAATHAASAAAAQAAMQAATHAATHAATQAATQAATHAATHAAMHAAHHQAAQHHGGAGGHHGGF